MAEVKQAIIYTIHAGTILPTAILAATNSTNVKAVDKRATNTIKVHINANICHISPNIFQTFSRFFFDWVFEDDKKRK